MAQDLGVIPARPFEGVGGFLRRHGRGDASPNRFPAACEARVIVVASTTPLRVPFSHGRHLRPEFARTVGDDATTDPVEKEEEDGRPKKHAAIERQ
jgi:hypothetical protein